MVTKSLKYHLVFVELLNNLGVEDPSSGLKV